MKKKNFLLGLISLLALCTCFYSCSDDTEVKLANLTVTVSASETFNGLDMENLSVIVTNTSNQAEVSALTNADGAASFIDLAPGIYNLSCIKELTAEEASSASGYFEEITLNGTKINVSLMGGIDSTDELVLDGTPSSSLVIKEFYYSGADDGYVTMFKDQFVEIYNNSAEVVYADGLYLASIVPQTNGSNDDDEITTLPIGEFVYADKITQVPGSGEEYPVQPGESIVIALNAVDYSNGGANDKTIDNSGADFEMYAIDWLESLNRQGSAFWDVDNADVTNMNGIYLNIENYGFFGFMSTGASIAILRIDETPSETILDPAASESNPIYYAKLNSADIIDGVDLLANAEAGDFKRLPASVDAGFNFVPGSSYTSLSVSRKIAKTMTDGRIIYKDTNNSTEDFESGLVTE